MCISFPSDLLAWKEMTRRARWQGGPAAARCRPTGTPLPSPAPRSPCGGHRLSLRGSALADRRCRPRSGQYSPGEPGGAAPGNAPAVIARDLRGRLAPARRGFQRLLASAHRRGERGCRGRGGSGQGWAEFFSCPRSGTCKLKPKVPPELMSVCVCVCVRGLLCA